MATHCGQDIQTLLDSMGVPASWFSTTGDLLFYNNKFALATNNELIEPFPGNASTMMFIKKYINLTLTASKSDRSSFSCQSSSLLRQYHINFIKMTEDNQISGLICMLTKVVSMAGESKPSKEITGFVEHIYNTLPACIYWQDLNGRVIDCNQYQLDFLNFTDKDSFINKDLYSILPSEVANHILTDINHIIQTQTALIQIEEAYIQGTLVKTISHKAPIFDTHDNIIGVIGVSINLSDAIAENSIGGKPDSFDVTQNSNNFFIKDFLLNIKHDFRLPLSGIVGYAENLRYTVSPQYYRNIDLLIASCTEAVSLINDVIEANDLSFKNSDDFLEQFSIINLLKNLENLYAASCKYKGLTLNISIDPNLGPTYYGNRKMIKRILIDLISNSVKYTHVGHITVSAKIINNCKRVSLVMFEVRDTGIGIQYNNSAKKMKKFSKADPSYKDEVSGTGLGLWRVKKMLDFLDGEMKFNKVSHGTCIEFIIPLRESVF